MFNIQELYSFDLGVEEIETPFGNKVRCKHKKDVSVIYLSDLIIIDSKIWDICNKWI